jgi:membrane protein DedA with SNARE-associated domain
VSMLAQGLAAINLPTGGLALFAYLLLGGIIGLESMGIPLPGETTLVAAGLLASQHKLSLGWVIAAAATGAIVGDSIGYAVGRRYGGGLFDRLGRRSHHFSAERIASAERYFHRYGMWTVFFGRFVALLRILAGPMAGSLRMHYPRFLLANAAGGIVWASLVATVAYKIGEHADKIFGQVSLIALIAVVVALMVAWIVFKRRRARKARETGENPPEPERADDVEPV